jgi:hypothetical protein
VILIIDFSGNEMSKSKYLDNNWVRGFKSHIARVICISAVAASPASADIYCASLVNEALTYSNGDVMVYPAWRNDWLTICNINMTRNNVSPQMCFAWFSTINNAILYNKSVGFYYVGTDLTGCPLVPTYGGSPSPLYVRITK